MRASTEHTLPAKQRRCLHGALLEALQQEAKAQEGSAAAAQPDAAAAGQDVEMPDAGAQGAPGGGAAGAAAGAAAGGAGGRRPRVTVSSLSPAQQDRVVEQMVQGADIQLGLVNACIEVGAACVEKWEATGQRCSSAAALAGWTCPHQCIRQFDAGGPEHSQLSWVTVAACLPPLQQVVNYAHLRSREHAFPWATLQLGRLHYALELWQVGAQGLEFSMGGRQSHQLGDGALLHCTHPLKWG